jgi:putative lipoic acid-binding regulatory protein
LSKKKQDESLLKFPCEFNLKVIGHNNQEFKLEVLTIFRKQSIDLAKNSISTRESSDHKYLAITITFTAKTKKQLDKLYQALHDCDKVVMTL